MINRRLLIVDFINSKNDINKNININYYIDRITIIYIKIFIISKTTFE